MSKLPFTHLHVHSDYSLLTGLAKVSDIVKKAKADGMASVAMTDFGSMYGIIEFYQQCKKQGIKPIIGAELYLAPQGMHNKRAKIDEERHTIVLLAKNNTGYKNLMKLVSLGHLEGFYYKPRIDFDILSRHSEGLIALTGSLQGEIPKAILRNYDLKKTDEIVQRYRDVFGPENLFVEIIRHPHIAEQELVNKRLLELAERNGLPIVAAADVYYLNTEDDQAHDILLCIQNNRKVFEDNRFTMKGEDYSFLPADEMNKRFEDLPEAILNTQRIAERCNVELEFGMNRLPAFDIPSDTTYESYLRKLCYRGLVKCYGGKLNDEETVWEFESDKPLIVTKVQNFLKKDVMDRMEYELSVIEKTGFASYFLIVADFINWAKNNGIVVGPGRGSAAGSFVAYLTGITDMDPLQYDLLFERFLNPERISMPDIDTDFADTRRDQVMKYVQGKYGHDHVAGIVTFGTLGARAVIRDVGRSLGIEYAYCDKLSKMIPMMTDLSTALNEVPELKAEYKNSDVCRNVIDNALKLEGVNRHASQHACGVLITKDPLTEYVPVQHATSEATDTVISQYSLHPVEDLGLLKMDFLGLKNLTIIENALEAIEKIHGVKIDLHKINLEDKKTLELLCRGETTGVFQFESSGMKRYLKQLQPSGLEDLIAMNALYRPGPLDAGMVEEYIARKQGQKKITYEHPLLEPILNTTYGVIVYQEQVMRIARDMGGFTLGQADVLRKAVGKKIKELMDEQKQKLVAGMLKNRIDKKIANEIWRQIETFARYGFNRSHSACYGLIAYQTAYLKSNYPAEFMSALLTSDLDDIERISIEISECRQMGIDVLSPDINESFSRFTVVADSLQEGKPRIRFGLSAVKGLGENIAKAIIHERKEGGPYESLEDFLLRITSRDLNKKSLDSLIRSGALDRFGERNEMLLNMERIIQFVKENHREADQNQHNLFQLMETKMRPTLTLEKFPPTDKRSMLSWEKELLGFYLSEHPFDDYQKELQDYIVDTVSVSSGKFKGHVRVAGLISSVKKIITKKGELMLFVNIEDTKGTAEIIVFPSVYNTTSDLWVENSIVIVSGNLSEKEGEAKVICNEVKVLTVGMLRELKTKMTKLNLEVAKDMKNLFIFFKQVIGAQTVAALSEILQGKTGNNKVYLAVPIDQKKFRKIETNFSVNIGDNELMDRLGQLSDVRFVKIM